MSFGLSVKVSVLSTYFSVADSSSFFISFFSVSSGFAATKEAMTVTQMMRCRKI